MGLGFQCALQFAIHIMELQISFAKTLILQVHNRWDGIDRGIFRSLTKSFNRNFKPFTDYFLHKSQHREPIPLAYTKCPIVFKKGHVVLTCYNYLIKTLSAGSIFHTIVIICPRPSVFSLSLEIDFSVFISIHISQLTLDIRDQLKKFLFFIL